eukprot:UN11622
MPIIHLVKYRPRDYMHIPSIIDNLSDLIILPIRFNHFVILF